MTYFQQLLNDGQADLALVQTTVLQPYKAVCAAANKQAKREGYVTGLDICEMDFSALEDTLRDQANAEAESYAASYLEIENPEDRAIKQRMWPIERLRTHCLADLVKPFRYSANAHIEEANARVAELVAQGLAAVGLTLKQVEAAVTAEREAKRKITNAKANLAGKGLASRLSTNRRGEQVWRG